MLALLLTALLAAIILLKLFLKKKQKIIRFVGPRKTGKTSTINYLLNNPQTKTVPTLETYSVQLKNVLIYDTCPDCNESDVYKKYDMNYEDSKYFFFFNNSNEANEVPDDCPFDVEFVCVGANVDGIEEGKKVMFLDGNFEKLKYKIFKYLDLKTQFCTKLDAINIIY